MWKSAFKQEQLNYGMDSMSLDSGEDSKADDMDEMTMPNPGSIQVSLDSDSLMTPENHLRVKTDPWNDWERPKLTLMHPMRPDPWGPQAKS